MDADWISITEAARRLNAAGDPIDRSTLSRYLKQHSEALPLREDGRSNLVNFEDLLAHRGENIRLRTPAAAPSKQSAQPSSRQGRFSGSQSDGIARKAQADAEMREMDLALRRRELTPTAEVDRAGRDAVALMMSAFDQAIETKAQDCALKYGWDERTARIALKSFAKDGLAVFHRSVLESLDRFRRAEDAGDEASEAAGEAVLQ